MDNINNENLEDIKEKINNEMKKETKEELVDEENTKACANNGEQIDNVLDLEELQKMKEDNMLFKNKNQKLENELEALKDRLLRLNAEYENYRKRTEKEKERIYTDACEDILKKVLPVLDNLERAVTVNGNVDDLKKGIEMTIRQFIDSLDKLQVEEIDAKGEFDPNFHQAVMHMQDEALGTNQVVEVLQKGYKRGDKVIRHTMVKVCN